MPVIYTARETQMWGLGRPRRYVLPPCLLRRSGPDRDVVSASEGLHRLLVRHAG